MKVEYKNLTYEKEIVMDRGISVKNADLKFKISDWKGFFKGLVGTTINLALMDIPGIAQSLLDVAESTELSNDERRTFQLLTNTMVQAVILLLGESGYREFETFEFDNELESLFTEQEFCIDIDFFNNPKEHKVVEEIQKILRAWLPLVGASAADVTTIVNRFPEYFVYALNDEWRTNQNRYESLKSYFYTPFMDAEGMELDWRRYRAWLNKNVNEGMLGEKFGLADIYVSLCAYYEEKPNKKDSVTERVNDEETQKIVVDLEPEILSWIKNDKKEDAIRVISGGPGSGKSSFAKILAAKYSEETNVLLIPLHKVNLTKSFRESIGGYLADAKAFNQNPLEHNKKMLIILDGLDELIHQGKACAEAAKEFIEEVRRYINALSDSDSIFKVLITGRVLVVQSIETCFREEGQVLHVLPYYLSDNDKEEYIDEQGFLAQDKRDEWWKNYGTLTGNNYSKLPSQLQGRNLDELTAQPLLNFLVALSLARGFEFTDKTNLNEVYDDLINAVYVRGYGSGTHIGAGDISLDKFEQFLQEIAVAAWQSSGRTITIKDIQNHFKQNEIKLPLERFRQDAEAGVADLLTAFYFRQTIPGQSGDATFEFTHKSFGEYLAAKKLVRQIEMMENKGKRWEETEGDEGWNEKETLRRWAVLCGKVSIDKDIFRFLKDEIALRDKEDKAPIADWQKRICKLISYILKKGMPFEELRNSVPTFLEEKRQSRNAEETLLASLSACALVTDEISNIEWPDETSAGNWFSLLRGQRESVENGIALRCLNHLDLEKCCLDLNDFFEASMGYSNMKDCSFQFAILIMADLSGVDLSNADLSAANLSTTILKSANLEDASLEDIDLSYAKLINANLKNADLTCANLKNADLTGANLKNATLPDGSIYVDSSSIEKFINGDE